MTEDLYQMSCSLSNTREATAHEKRGLLAIPLLAPVGVFGSSRKQEPVNIGRKTLDVGRSGVCEVEGDHVYEVLRE